MLFYRLVCLVVKYQSIVGMQGMCIELNIVESKIASAKPNDPWFPEQGTRSVLPMISFLPWDSDLGSRHVLGNQKSFHFIFLI